MDLLAYDVSEESDPPLNPCVVQSKTLSRPIAPSTVSDEEYLEVKKLNCKPKYRVRWFSSKGALLVLLWTVLLNFSAESLSNSRRAFSGDESINDFLADFLPYIMWGVFTPLAGWLADSYFGTYQVTKIGILLLFLSTVVNCMLFQIVGYALKFDSPLFLSLLDLFNAIGLIGQGVVLVTLVTLGLHQMPDASTNNMTSFIAWFIGSYFTGYWICDMSSYIPIHCMDLYKDYIRIWTLFPVLAMCIVLVTDFLLVPKWLIIEPNGPQSLKTIYQVLKFAARHKSPLRRSAFTYWEEDIPSRIDLGKSKYGGPFSTEEVEDVKTSLRLLAISVPVFFIIVSFYLWASSPSYSKQDKSCEGALISNIVGNDHFAVVFGTLVYEFLIFPPFAHLLPGFFKRIGITSFLLVLLSIVHFGLYIAQTFSPDLVWPWLDEVHSIFVGIVMILWMTSMLELIVAQSPYRMRGVSMGYFWYLYLSTQLVIYINECQEMSCHMIHGGLSIVFSVVGFVLYCILARWYKRRVREDIATPYQWAEDCYDR